MANLEPIDRDGLLTKLRELLALPSVRKRSLMAQSSWSAVILVRSLSESVKQSVYRPLPSLLGWAAHPGSSTDQLCNLELATAPGFYADDDTSQPDHRCA